MTHNFVRRISRDPLISSFKKPISKYQKHAMNQWRPKALKRICMVALVTTLIFSLAISEVQSDPRADLLLHKECGPWDEWSDWTPWRSWVRTCSFTLTRSRSRQRSRPVTDTYIERWIDNIGNWWIEESDCAFTKELRETQVEWEHEWKFSLGFHVSLFSHANYGVITDMVMGIPEVTDYVAYIDGEAIISPLCFNLISVGSHNFYIWVDFLFGN